MGAWLVARLSAWIGTDEFTLTYRLIAWLGLVNIVLTVLAATLFAVRRVNKYAFANKNATLKNIVKPLSKAHPVFGILLLLSAYVHGELALGSVFRVHTGSLALLVVVVMMLVALLGKQLNIRNWLIAHRGLAIALAVSVALHLYARNLFG